MLNIRYCTLCLQPDTRPNTRFDEDGVCPACTYFHSLVEVDWDERRKKLAEICTAFAKKSPFGKYDCIVGVSGGKDSTRQALYIRDVCKLTPLLVCLSYPPGQAVARGAANLSNLANQGFDILTIQPAPELWRKLVRKGFFQFANWCKSTELSLFSSVPRTAVAWQIPLIFWGENPALQLGDLGTAGREGWDGNNLRNANTLGGADMAWILKDRDYEKKQLLQYVYPSPEEMDRAGMQIVFLGYFWNDWSLLDNAAFSTLRGLDIRSEPPEDIGDPFGVTSLDEDWVGMNQMIKYLKFGFGRTTDYANEEIRKGTMTREQGIELVRKYDGKCASSYVESFCRYIDISVAEFWEVVDAHVNKKLFRKDAEGKWTRQFEIG